MNLAHLNRNNDADNPFFYFADCGFRDIEVAAAHELHGPGYIHHHFKPKTTNELRVGRSRGNIWFSEIGGLTVRGVYNRCFRDVLIQALNCTSDPGY